MFENLILFLLYITIPMVALTIIGIIAEKFFEKPLRKLYEKMMRGN